MRRVTEVTKEMPVSRHVSCSTFSRRLLEEENIIHEPSLVRTVRAKNLWRL